METHSSVDDTWSSPTPPPNTPSTLANSAPCTPLDGRELTSCVANIRRPTHYIDATICETASLASLNDSDFEPLTRVPTPTRSPHADDNISEIISRLLIDTSDTIPNTRAPTPMPSPPPIDANAFETAPLASLSDSDSDFDSVPSTCIPTPSRSPPPHIDTYITETQLSIDASDTLPSTRAPAPTTDPGVSISSNHSRCSLLPDGAGYQFPVTMGPLDQQFHFESTLWEACSTYLAYCKVISLHRVTPLAFMNTFQACLAIFKSAIIISQARVEETFLLDMWQHGFMRCYFGLRDFSLSSHELTSTFLESFHLTIQDLQLSVPTSVHIWDSWEASLIICQKRELSKAQDRAAKSPSSGLMTYYVAQFTPCLWNRLCQCYKSLYSRDAVRYEDAHNLILPKLRDADPFIQIFGAFFCGIKVDFDVDWTYISELFDEKAEPALTAAGYIVTRAILPHENDGPEANPQARVRLGFEAMETIVKRYKQPRYLGAIHIIVQALHQLTRAESQLLLQFPLKHIIKMANGLSRQLSQLDTSRELFPLLPLESDIALGDAEMSGTDLHYLARSWNIPVNPSDNTSDQRLVTTQRRIEFLLSCCCEHPGFPIVKDRRSGIFYLRVAPSPSAFFKDDWCTCDQIFTDFEDDSDCE